MISLTRVTTAIYLLLPASVGLAQESPVRAALQTAPASADVLAKFQLDRATVQTLRLPSTPDGAFDVFVELDGELRRIALRPHDLFASDAQFLVTGAQNYAIPRPPSVAYRGTVEGLPGSQVAAGYYDGGLRAVVWLTPGRPAWGIDPLDTGDSRHVVFDSRHLRTEGTCGVTTVGVAQATPPPQQPIGLDVLELAEIVIECDEPFMAQRGNNPTTATNSVNTIMNAVDFIYTRDCDITYSITTILFNIGSDPYTTNTAEGGNGLLSQFENNFISNHNGLQRDVAHLFSGRNFTGTTIGYAAVSAICSSTRGYGISQHVNLSTADRTAVVAHELGHNWSANHCDGNGDCRIMCSGLGGCTGDITSFGPQIASQIISYKNTRGCLSQPGPPVLTSVTPDTVSVLGETTCTLSGSNFSSVTEVRIIGVTLGTNDFNIVNDNTIQFSPPTPLSVGANFVWCIGPGGASGVQSLTYEITDPPAIDTDDVVVTAIEDWYSQYGSTPGHNYWVVASVNDPTTLYVDLFQIDFLINSFLLTNGTLDGLGLAEYTLPLMPNDLFGLTVYTQLLTAPPTLVPLRESAVESTLFF